MGLGILEDRVMDHVPGTSNLLATTTIIITVAVAVAKLFKTPLGKSANFPPPRHHSLLR